MEEHTWNLLAPASGPDGLRDLAGRLAAAGTGDLIVFAHDRHGRWDEPAAVERHFGRLLTAGAAPRAEGGVALLNVRWPSMRFPDERVPASGHAPPDTVRDAAPDLSVFPLDDLLALFPGRADTVYALDDAFRHRRARHTDLDDVGLLLRRLVALPLGAPGGAAGSDTTGEIVPQSDPAMLFDPAVEVCGRFTDFLELMAETCEEAGTRRSADNTGPAEQASPEPLLEDRGDPPEVPDTTLREPGTVTSSDELDADRGRHSVPHLWDGAYELLRQVTYHALRRRAAVLGRERLAAGVRTLRAAAPGTRVHLVGHGMGARLAAHALTEVRTERDPAPVASLTLLQAAVSHHVFAPSIPWQLRGRGRLHDVVEAVAGPLVVGHSGHDLLLGLMFPQATKMTGDAAGHTTPDRRWGALGFDGAQGVDGGPELTLATALRAGLPESGIVNVDTSAVVRRGGPPNPGHDDIWHEDVARLVLAAAGLAGPA
ncbi:alpha/beta hydrolase [Streptomyces sp. NPDC090306]|uniref:alpha/beta hydrolase n=1 Tax=Streptomyces sp. NPDC090306 TaxID=3365961 RepID=UPI00380C23C1